MIISRAQSGRTSLGLNFDQVHSGWRTQIHDPMLEFLNNVFRASSLFLYTFTSIYGHPALEMRQDFALPGSRSTSESQPDPSSPTKSHNYQTRACINSDATPEDELINASGMTNFDDLIRMSDESGSEGSVILFSIYSSTN